MKHKIEQQLTVNTQYDNMNSQQVELGFCVVYTMPGLSILRTFGIIHIYTHIKNHINIAGNDSYYCEGNVTLAAVNLFVVIFRNTRLELES